MADMKPKATNVSIAFHNGFYTAYEYGHMTPEQAQALIEGRAAIVMKEDLIDIENDMRAASTYIATTTKRNLFILKAADKLKAMIEAAEE